MEKTNIVIGFKVEDDPNPDIVFCGDIDGCLNAYKEELHGEKYHFLGMLRKPSWFKRGKPPLVQRQRDEAHKQLEDELRRKQKDATAKQAEADKAKNTVDDIEEQLEGKGEKSKPAKKTTSKVGKSKS